MSRTLLEKSREEMKSKIALVTANSSSPLTRLAISIHTSAPPTFIASTLPLRRLHLSRNFRMYPSRKNTYAMISRVCASAITVSDSRIFPSSPVLSLSMLLTCLIGSSSSSTSCGMMRVRKFIRWSLACDSCSDGDRCILSPPPLHLLPSSSCLRLHSDSSGKPLLSSCSSSTSNVSMFPFPLIDLSPIDRNLSSHCPPLKLSLNASVHKIVFGAAYLHIRDAVLVVSPYTL
mmetsp:Transcript_11571/g.39943  ORF Transcript_11571/g.39943 Transcript_11571/m.39943 type:complete len:232 (-) Transcript_11571:987-1682(-)